MSLLFRLRLRHGLCWPKSHYWPARDEWFVIAGVALVVVILYAAVAYVLVLEREQAARDAAEQARKKQSQTEKVLLDCLNDRVVFVAGKVGVRCKSIEVPI